MAKTKAAPPDPFVGLTFTPAPEPVKIKRTVTPPPVPDSLQPLIQAVRDSAHGVDLSIAGWSEDQVATLEKVLRLNRPTLFPQNRLYIIPQDGGASLRIRLGNLGKVRGE